MKQILLIISIIVLLVCPKNNICMQQHLPNQNDLNHILFYVIKLATVTNNLVNPIKLSENKIYELLNFEIPQEIFNQDQEFYNNIISKKQKLLKIYLNYNKDKNPITSQFEKIVNILKEPLIRFDYLWYIIEESIEEYCALGQFISNKEEFKNNIKKIYSAHQESTLANLFCINNSLKTNTALKYALKGFYTYAYDLKIKRVQKLQQIKNLTKQAEKEKQAQTPEQTEIAVKEEAKIEESEPRSSARISVSQRKKDKKAKKNNLDPIIEEKEVVRQQKEKLTDYQKILLAIKTNDQQIESEKFITKIQQLDLEEERDDAFYALLQNFIENNKEDKVFYCLKKAPKKPNFLFEYIKLIIQKGLFEKNAETIFEYTKICLMSKFKEEEICKIIDEQISKSSCLKILLLYAKLEIFYKKRIDFFIELFDKEISKNNTENIIQAIVETGMYTELIKWINESSIDIIKIYENKLIDYSNTVVSLSDPIFYTFYQIYEFLSDKSSVKPIAKQEKTISDKQKKWIKLNIKLLEAIAEKTQSINAKKRILDICINFGFNYLENPINFQKYINEYSEDIDDLYNIGGHLIFNNKTNELAIECFRFCATKFNDIRSMFITAKLLIDSIDKKEFIIEAESWVRKIIEIENPVSDLAKFYLGAILTMKRNLDLEFELKEIIENLENNSYHEAKILYAQLYLDYSHIMKINPDELIQTTIDQFIKYKNEINENRLETDLNIKDLFSSLLLNATITIEKNTVTSIIACKMYENLDNKYTEEELLSFKKVIYNNPLCTKNSGWQQRFKILNDSWNEHFTGISFVDYLNKIGVSPIETNYFSNIMNYNIELLPDQKVYIQDKDGNTILFHAIAENQKYFIKFLLNNHPELIKIYNNINETALIKALQLCLTKPEETVINIIRMLIEKDPNILNIHNDRKQNPLHLAAFWGFIKVAKLFIEEYDADSTKEDDEIISPFKYAIMGNQIEFINYLISAQREKLTTEKIMDALYMSVSKKRLEIFKKLLSLIKVDTKKLIISCACVAITKRVKDFIMYFVENKFIEPSIEMQPDFTILDFAEAIKLKIERRISNALDRKIQEKQKVKLKEISEIIKYLQTKNPKKQKSRKK